jgi:hypothetical protein
LSFNGTSGKASILPFLLKKKDIFFLSLPFPLVCEHGTELEIKDER